MDLIRSILLSESSIKELEQRVEDGELTEDLVADTIEAIEGEIGAKCDSIAEIITANTTSIAGLEAEVKRLQNLIDNKKMFNSYLKDGLHKFLKRNDTNKVKTAFHSFSICRNGGKLPLQITDEVPEEFLKYEPRTDLDKIREALDDGNELYFACYGERGEHLRIK